MLLILFYKLFDHGNKCEVVKRKDAVKGFHTAVVL